MYSFLLKKRTLVYIKFKKSKYLPYCHKGWALLHNYKTFYKLISIFGLKRITKLIKVSFSGQIIQIFKSFFVLTSNDQKNINHSLRFKEVNLFLNSRNMLEKNNGSGGMKGISYLLFRILVVMWWFFPIAKNKEFCRLVT